MTRTLASLTMALSGAVLFAAASAATADDLVAQGSFEGRSNHITTGTATIVKTDTGYQVVLQRDFTFDGAPDPKLGFGNGQNYDISSQFSPLAANTGTQTYELPANVDPKNYDTLYLWCEQFSVPLGVAKLN